MKYPTDLPKASQSESESKWGYAFAGAIALGFAALIQFAFGDPAPDALENMPAILSVPYAVAGKLGLTIPLAVLGLGLIARDVLMQKPSAPVRAASPKKSRKPKPTTEEIETGEPLAEEIDEAADDQQKQPTGVTKIPAKGGGGFAGRVAGGGKAPGGGGQMVLSTAKYMNQTQGKPNFRKGKTETTNDS